MYPYLPTNPQRPLWLYQAVEACDFAQTRTIEVHWNGPTRLRFMCEATSFLSLQTGFGMLHQAVEACDFVLSVEPSNSKALHRKGPSHELDFEVTER